MPGLKPVERLECAVEDSPRPWIEQKCAKLANAYRDVTRWRRKIL